MLTVAELADRDGKERVEGTTVLLAPSAGGLERGMLNGSAAVPETGSLDVADEWYLDKEKTSTPPSGSKRTSHRTGCGSSVALRYPVTTRTPIRTTGTGSKSAMRVQNLRRIPWSGVSTSGMWSAIAGDIVDRLSLGDGVRRAVKVAAKFHDHGKRRKLFQTILGNPNYPKVVLAKSGRKGGRVEEQYRHEFGSLVDLQKEPEFQILVADDKDLVLHLIAATTASMSALPDRRGVRPGPFIELSDGIAREVPRRFARLQRKYGRWGLAYLESLLRAADWAASAKPSKYLREDAK